MINVAANDLELFEFTGYAPNWMMSLLYNIGAAMAAIFFFGYTTLFILCVSIFTLAFSYIMS
jgi:hypothetical protein